MSAPMSASSSAQGSSPTPTSEPAEADPLRQSLRAMWSAAAPGWERHARFVERREATVSDLLLASLRPGTTVLELGCGPGGLGLAAAERVGPSGSVVLSDVVHDMLAVAERAVAERGLPQVSTRLLDLEDLDLPDRSVDVVLCREALMLVPEPSRAAAEMARVLRPGGHAAVSVWGPRPDNPWIAVLLDAVGDAVGMEVPPPGIPGPFSLDDADRLAALFRGDGFADVQVRAVATPWEGPSFDEWWNVVPALAGPVGTMLAGLPPETAEAIRAACEQELVRYESATGLEVPGLTLVATARR